MPDYTEKDLQMYMNQAMEYASRATLPTEENSEFYENGDVYERFLREHTGSGTLKIQVTAAEALFPLDNTIVEIKKNYGGQEMLFYKDTTDISGILEGLTLPTLPTEFSQSSVTAPESGTEYLVSVYNPSFVEKDNLPIKIYDKIETILPIILQPKIDI